MCGGTIFILLRSIKGEKKNVYTKLFQFLTLRLKVSPFWHWHISSGMRKGIQTSLLMSLRVSVSKKEITWSSGNAGENNTFMSYLDFISFIYQMEIPYSNNYCLNFDTTRLNVVSDHCQRRWGSTFWRSFQLGVLLSGKKHSLECNLLKLLGGDCSI